MGHISFAVTAILACAAPISASSARNARNSPLYVEKQFSQSFLDGYNTLKHVGGNGPYSDRSSFGIDRDPPAGCTVDQVIMIHRHGERYPVAGTGAAIEGTLAKIYGAKISNYEGDLAFFKDWEYFVPESSYYELETFSGPYAGLLDAYNRGTQYRARYGHLWDGKSVVPIFSSDFERVIETARKFGEGFFQYNYSTNAAINLISESEKQGADSLTPTCIHDNDTAVCDSLGDGPLLPQFDVAAARMNEQNPQLKINASDVYNLMSMYSLFQLQPYRSGVAVYGSRTNSRNSHGKL
jgi:acid phosphatase